MEKFKSKQQELTNKYYNEVVKPLLPFAQQGTSYAFGQNIPSQLEISPKLENASLNASQYEYKSTPFKFIHYTNLNNARSILSSKKLRMYSLASMNDKQELTYALNDIIPDKSDFTIGNYKNEVFSLSMNEFQTEMESENTWAEYGDKGCGVGVVLQFPFKTKNKWYQHYLSKIHYQDKKLDALKQFHIRHTDFITSQNIRIIGQVKHFMLPLAAFHKTNGYEKENELRFIIVNTSLYDSWIERKYDVIIDGIKTFIELDLELNKKEEYGEIRPIPVIKKIILGPNIVKKEKHKDEFLKLSFESLGYNIQVVNSIIDAL